MRVQLAHSIVVYPAQAPGPVTMAVTMAVTDCLPGYQLQCLPVLRSARPLPFRFPGRSGKTKVRQCRDSCSTASKTFGISCSLTGEEAYMSPKHLFAFDRPVKLTGQFDNTAAILSYVTDRGSGGRRRSKGGRPELIEEDIYTVNDGWKVGFDPSEEMMEVAGVQIPVKLKQQLQRERRSKRVITKSPAEPPRTTHKLLRVMAGRCAGKKLTSPADAKVRPMMEVVRGAVFNILQSLESWSPTSSSRRWLDLYSGTGSVAIEGLSRGCCGEAHFVELDPWVISNVLRPNLEMTNFLDQTKIHTTKVEVLLQQASQLGASHFGGPFDFVSVTPPYEAVSYTQLMGQLSDSPLLSKSTFMVVEYPLASKYEMPDTCGPLVKIKDRRYGRTHVAIYGPAWVDRDDTIKAW